MNQESIMQKIGKKINAVMIKIFGANWRTSLYGILAFLPQIAQAVQSYVSSFGVPAIVLNTISFVFGILTVLNMKDRQVTGGSIQNDVEPKANG